MTFKKYYKIMAVNHAYAQTSKDVTKQITSLDVVKNTYDYEKLEYAETALDEIISNSRNKKKYCILPFYEAKN